MVSEIEFSGEKEIISPRTEIFTIYTIYLCIVLFQERIVKKELINKSNLLEKNINELNIILILLKKLGFLDTGFDYHIEFNTEKSEIFALIPLNKIQIHNGYETIYTRIKRCDNLFSISLYSTKSAKHKIAYIKISIKY